VGEGLHTTSPSKGGGGVAHPLGVSSGGCGVERE